MPKTVSCDIVSAEKSIFSGKVKLLVATGTLGELGITPGHAQLLTTLKPGPVRIITDEDNEEIYYISGGFLEVQPSKIKLLSDSALREHNLNEAAALEAKQIAEQAIKKNGNTDFDYKTALHQLEKATAKLRTIQMLNRRKKTTPHKIDTRY